MKDNAPDAAARAELQIVRLLIPGPMKSIEISERTGMCKNRVRGLLLKLKKAEVVERLPKSTLIALTQI